LLSGQFIFLGNVWHTLTYKQPNPPEIESRETVRELEGVN
jgi:hypothetical protein